MTARPAPSENSVTAKTNPATATGSDVRTYPNVRKVGAAKGARQKPGRDVRKAGPLCARSGRVRAGAVVRGRVSIVMAGLVLVSARQPRRVGAVAAPCLRRV
ncbi:hypothetical protein [Streptomyces typhae]|uniref:hypothetical protein n=1 Tax=Streptomyces typhae TaxID=2681492 RepID=UPI0018DFE882|nr:hypothetical protein [Streptomyces typhae]